MKNIKFILIIISYSCTCFSQIDSCKIKIRDYLMQNYTGGEYKSDSSFSIVVNNKIKVFKRDSKIECISTPFITSKTGLKIYNTYLYSGYSGYTYLDVALSIDSINNIVISHTPDFDTCQTEFNNRFLDLLVENDSEKKDFMIELSTIYSRISLRDCSIINIENNGKLWTIDLGGDDWIWRKIKVEFIQNRVSKIDLNR